jgi:hypothetical protein
VTSPPPQGWKRERASWRERGKSIVGFRIGSYSGQLRCCSGPGIEANHRGSNTALQASLRLAFCHRRQAVIAGTLGISPGAKAIDVGCAGPLLFRRGDIGRRRTGGERRQQQTKRRGKMGAAGASGNSGKPCLYDSTP